MKLRTIAADIFQRTLTAIEVESVVGRSLQLNGDTLRVCDSEVDLNHFSRLLVAAIGKAALPMARATAKLLGDRITQGIVATSAVMDEAPEQFQVFIGGHPLPNQSSLDAAESALQLL